MRNSVILGFVTAMLWLPGCADPGPERAEVHGSVRLDGAAVAEGAIQFIPTDGNQGPGTGAAIQDGAYAIPRRQGPVVGKNRVELRAFRKSAQRIQDPTAAPGVLANVRVQVFPPEFNDESKVVKEILRGSNEIDFDVSTNSGRP